MMSISTALKERNQGLCELCNSEPSTAGYTVSPKSDDYIRNQVALCQTCLDELGSKGDGFYWRCLEGSIWSVEPAVQALSYRILQDYKSEDWVANLLGSVDPDEEVIQWAMSVFDTPDVHKDAYGNPLENGDNVVLVQALDVKGTNFTASKGTVVKRIRLVHDNPEQIEGKIKEQTIVILTRYVKKS
jgi:protein PhnA